MPQFSPRAMKITPHKITDSKGNPVDADEVLGLLKRDMTMLADCVESELLNRDILGFYEKLADEDKSPRQICEALEMTTQGYCAGSGRAGRSRMERIFAGLFCAHASSWLQRVKACEENPKDYISQGWKRTADPSRPRNIKPTMNLSYAGDNRFAEFLENPISNPVFRLKMVVDGRWFIFHFDLTGRIRKDAAKITLPNIFVDDKGKVVFVFSQSIPYHYPLISSRFIVAVDVGVVHSATFVVYDSFTGDIVYRSTGSRRVHSLENKIRACETQKKNLIAKGRPIEAASHKRAASRKKKELAIIIGQEVADVAHAFDNAVVVVEDLSWIKNTMDNGRWNRGEVVKRITEQVDLNCSRVFTVNAANSSTTCHHCGQRGYTDTERNFLCRNPGCLMLGVFQDRDENAAGELARRCVERVRKAAETRKKTNRKRKDPTRMKRRTPKTRDSLKYPGRDRTKNHPTPKRERRRTRRHWEIKPPVQHSAPCASRHTVKGDARPTRRRETLCRLTMSQDGKLSRVTYRNIVH